MSRRGGHPADAQREGSGEDVRGQYSRHVFICRSVAKYYSHRAARAAAGLRRTPYTQNDESPCSATKPPHQSTTGRRLDGRASTKAGEKEVWSVRKG